MANNLIDMLDNGKYTKIKVIGVGGGGMNAVHQMMKENVAGVEFMVMNTDQHILDLSPCEKKLAIGENLTKGLGAGGKPEIGRQAAEESKNEISQELQDMVFITAGMGGGTGTGAAPIIAGVAKNMGALTVAVVTKPFDFEGNKRREIAEEGIAALKDKVDTLIVVPNQRLLEIVDEGERLSFIDAMKKVDSVLAEGVNSISNLISQTGYINADFNDAKSVMQNAGTALMGIGRASGENRAENAARAATTSPLLDMSIEGATGVLYNVVGADLTLTEISLVSELIKEAVDPAANIKFGAQIDPNAGDELTITIVATGFDENKQVYTKKQKDDDDVVKPEVRTFGFKPKAQELPEIGSLDTEDEVLETFDKEEPLVMEELEKVEPVSSDDDDFSNGDVTGLDIPAFLRRKNS